MDFGELIEEAVPVPKRTVDDILERSLGTLTTESSNEDVLHTFRAFGEDCKSLDSLELQVVREGAIRYVKKDLGIASAAKMIDAVLPRTNGKQTQEQGHAVMLKDPEPWPEPVGGGLLLTELGQTFARFVALPKGAATALALWTVHAHALDAAYCSPLLVLTSPERRCGKTTTLKVLGAVVPRPLSAASISPAVLFRGVEKFHPTLLLDEAETAFRENEELRALVNAGHDRAGAVALRTVGDTHEPRMFSTWCPKAIALIGKLSGTLADRAIIIPMKRRTREEQIEPMRLERLGDLEPLRRRTWRWAQEHVTALRVADPDVPAELHDRAADNWRPLLAIADEVGGRWPAAARNAARLLSGGEDGDEDTPSILLLGDLRDLFQERAVERLASESIIHALAKMEERPWPEWRAGKPLSVRQLARLLGRFNVRPTQLWVDGAKVRGYDLTDFADAFARYLGSDTPTHPFRSGSPVDPSDDGGKSGFPSGTTDPLLPDRKTGESPANTGHPPDLPDETGGESLQEDISSSNGPAADPENPQRDSTRTGSGRMRDESSREGHSSRAGRMEHEADAERAAIEDEAVA